MRDEKGTEQGSTEQRSGLVEGHERVGKAESRQHMPKMKGLKELTLLVSSDRGGRRMGTVS